MQKRERENDPLAAAVTANNDLEFQEMNIPKELSPHEIAMLEDVRAAFEEAVQAEEMEKAWRQRGDGFDPTGLSQGNVAEDDALRYESDGSADIDGERGDAIHEKEYKDRGFELEDI